MQRRRGAVASPHANSNIHGDPLQAVSSWDSSFGPREDCSPLRRPFGSSPGSDGLGQRGVDSSERQMGKGLKPSKAGFDSSSLPQ